MYDTFKISDSTLIQKLLTSDICVLNESVLVQAQKWKRPETGNASAVSTFR